MIALGASLGLIMCGGTASALVLQFDQASTHKAPPSDSGPSGSGPSASPSSSSAPSGSGSSATAQVPEGCITIPHSCGFPDATDTGVSIGTALQSVPGQVSSGPGWYYNAAGNDVIVNVNGTVLSDLSIPYDVVIDASDVTVRDVQVVTGGAFGISLRHTTGVTIEDSTISGQNPTSGRVDAAIADVYGDSTGTVIESDNISQFRIGVQISTGLIADNYIHDPGYIRGDHTDGVLVAGTAKPLTIYGNTIFNNLGQTDDISLDASSSGHDVANKIVVGNLLAGGGYSIYGGDAHNDPTSDIVIEDNQFGQLYYPRSGQFGPVAYFDMTGTGNVWSGNIWSGNSVPGESAELPDASQSDPQPGSEVAG